jgi:tetratricopeptide (TPR) repeat protein
MIGKTYRAKEDYVKAEEYFQRSVDHGEEVGIVDPIPLRELVSTLAWQGKTGKAWKYYAQLQIHDSDPVHTRAMLIPIMVKNDQYQTAIDSFESLPKDMYSQLLPHVAGAHEGLSNLTAASHCYQQYLDSMDPNHPHVPVALCRFALVQLMMFNVKRAVELAQECVKRCRPENKEIRVAALNLIKEITPLLKKKPKRAGKRRMPRSK